MTTTRVQTTSSSAGQRRRRPTGTTLATVELGLAALGPVLVELTPSVAGTFQFWCRPQSGVTEAGVHEGMVGTLEIN